MKIYQILLLDKVTMKVEKIEDFKESESQNLKDKLLELQTQYCEDEKPEFFVKTFTSNGLKISTAVAESDSDYCYIAALKTLKNNVLKTKKYKKITQKETLSPAIHVMRCPQCGNIAASASERIFLPESTFCDNKNCNY